jgi:type IV secretion system protein VirB2
MATQTAPADALPQPPRAPAIALVALCCLLWLLPAIAWAQNSPFTAGTQSVKNDVLAIVTPFAGIAVIAVGSLCWFGKVSWWWLIGLVFGIVLVFGHEQVVAWIRGLFGV